MNNHFITPYNGNKRTEVKEIYKALDFTNIKYICEPFCGTSAISYYISTLHPKKYIYILNDIDNNLMKLYELMKDEIKWNYLRVLYELQIKAINNREFYKKIINQEGIISYLIKNKYYQIYYGVYPTDGRKKTLLNDNYPIINFLRQEKIILHNLDASEVLEKYNNKDVLFIMDPPYLFTCNAFYNNNQLKSKHFNIYEYILKSKKKYKCKIYFILELIWFIDIIFNKKVIHIYNKKYSGQKKKTVKHCVIKI